MRTKENQLTPAIKSSIKHVLVILFSLILLFITLPIVSMVTLVISASEGLIAVGSTTVLATFLILVATTPLLFISKDLVKRFSSASSKAKRNLQLLGFHLLTVAIFLTIGVTLYTITVNALGL